MYRDGLKVFVVATNEIVTIKRSRCKSKLIGIYEDDRLFQGSEAIILGEPVGMEFPEEAIKTTITYLHALRKATEKTEGYTSEITRARNFLMDLWGDYRGILNNLNEVTPGLGEWVFKQFANIKK